MTPTPAPGPSIPDPTSVATWPAAFVAMTLILSILVVPSVLSYLGNQRVKRVQETLQNTNGGSTVRDQLNRIEAQQQEQGKELHRTREDVGAVAVGLGRLRGEFEAHLTVPDDPHDTAPPDPATDDPHEGDHP